MTTNQYTWPTTSKSLVSDTSLGHCRNCGREGSTCYDTGPTIPTMSPSNDMKLQKCTECKAMLYCSKKCRKDHSKIHQPYCETGRRFTKELKAFGPEIVRRHKMLEAWYSKYAFVLSLAVASALRLDQGIHNIFASYVYFVLRMVDTGNKDHQGRPIFSYNIQDVTVIPYPVPPSFQRNVLDTVPVVDLPIIIRDMGMPKGHVLRHFQNSVYVLTSYRIRYYSDWKERLMAVVNEEHNFISWKLYDNRVLQFPGHWVLFPIIFLLAVFCWAYVKWCWSLLPFV